MSIISRYIGSSYLRIWAITILGLLLFYTSVDFVEKIDEFVSKDIPAKTTALFFVAQLPKIFVLLSPVASLIGTLLTIFIMARSSEIVAFKAGGVSLYKLSLPILGITAGLCLVIFLVGDMIAPRTNAVANYIWNGQVKQRLQQDDEVKDVWSKGVRMIQHYETYDNLRKSATGVSLVFLDEGMNISRRIEAEQATFINNKLVLENAMEKLYANTGDSAIPAFSFKKHQQLILDDWPAPTDNFGRKVENSEELSVSQLLQTIRRLSEEGISSTTQRVDLQFKFSFTMLSLIMICVGLPLAFWKEKGGSVALGLTAGLFLSFAYLIAMELAKSLGYAGLLPAFVAAWLPNMIFFLFGAYLFSYLRQ